MSESCLNTPVHVDGLAACIEESQLAEALEDIVESWHADLDNGIAWLTNAESLYFSSRYPRLNASISSAAQLVQSWTAAEPTTDDEE